MVTRLDIREGGAVHSGYAPGMPVPQGNGNRVAGPSGGDTVTSRERTYGDQATILDVARWPCRIAEERVSAPWSGGDGDWGTCTALRWNSLL